MPNARSVPSDAAVHTCCVPEPHAFSRITVPAAVARPATSAALAVVTRDTTRRPRGASAGTFHFWPTSPLLHVQMISGLPSAVLPLP
ncbi:hypothetical protein [Streptomyces atratus]|uniref:hypothetical protein n=1 Tax=Streptomyces atratus TaxID=1893 RepID=UPI00166F66CB|nr:hypothetical protein [Streptomyces atratus]